MPQPPIPEITAPPIHVRGAEDTYNDFERIYSAETLQSLFDLALSATRAAAADLPEDDIWASGFRGGYSPEELAATDAAKLARKSSTKDELGPKGPKWMRFDGDDSNESNIAERKVAELRHAKLSIVRDMSTLDQAGALSPRRQSAARARLAELDKQISAIRAAAQTAGNLPVYYATPASGMLETIAEDNPLAYIGDVPAVGNLMLYNGQAIAADPVLRVSNKNETPEQIRVSGRGLQIMRHALVVIRLGFVE